jgi:hypothetical protein
MKIMYTNILLQKTVFRSYQKFIVLKYYIRIHTPQLELCAAELLSGGMMQLIILQIGQRHLVQISSKYQYAKHPKKSQIFFCHKDQYILQLILGYHHIQQN